MLWPVETEPAGGAGSGGCRVLRGTLCIAAPGCDGMGLKPAPSLHHVGAVSEPQVRNSTKFNDYSLEHLPLAPPCCPNATPFLFLLPPLIGCFSSLMLQGSLCRGGHTRFTPY